MKRNFVIIVGQDEGRVYVGKISELIGCVIQGYTIDELFENLKDASSLYLELREIFIEDLREIEKDEGIQFESKKRAG